MAKQILRANVLTCLAPAKINLHLAIFQAKPGGLHPIESLMQSISLADSIRIKSHAKIGGISLSCNWPELAEAKSNLAYQAAALWRSATGDQSAIEIDIIKRIPLAAGLAGGSADAAAVLRLLQELAGTNGLPKTALFALAAKLGSDVPFCLQGGLAYVAGTGEKISNLAAKKTFFCLIVKPTLKISTATAFAELDQEREKQAEREASLSLDALFKKGEPLLENPAVLAQFRNDFEAMQCRKYPEIAILLQRLREQRPILAALSGSGPSCFALFDTALASEKALRSIKASLNENFEFFLAESSVSTEPMGRGFPPQGTDEDGRFAVSDENR